MMELRFTAKFKKDYKRIKRQGKDISKLESALEVLARGSRARGDARPLVGRDVPRAPGVPY